MTKYKDMSDYCWTIDESDMANEWLKVGAKIQELEAALPKWTRITDDLDTWPEYDVEYLFYRDTPTYSCAKGHTTDSYPTGNTDFTWEYTHWRPLCAFDYPPENDMNTQADDHYEYSRSREHVEALKDMPNRVLDAAIAELQVERNERDPDFEEKMK